MNARLGFKYPSEKKTLTLQLFRNKWRVNSFPKPEAAPVIKATFPWSFMFLFSCSED